MALDTVIFLSKTRDEECEEWSEQEQYTMCAQWGLRSFRMGGCSSCSRLESDAVLFTTASVRIGCFDHHA